MGFMCGCVRSEYSVKIGFKVDGNKIVWIRTNEFGKDAKTKRIRLRLEWFVVLKSSLFLRESENKPKHG